MSSGISLLILHIAFSFLLGAFEAIAKHCGYKTIASLTFLVWMLSFAVIDTVFQTAGELVGLTGRIAWTAAFIVEVILSFIFMMSGEFAVYWMQQNAAEDSEEDELFH
jgi:hypothetical protein